MDKNLTMKNLAPQMILTKRVEQNYADFKAEMLVLDCEDVYEMAGRITAVESAYYWLSIPYFLTEEDTEYMLRFHNPLEMLADFLEGQQGDGNDEIYEALAELFIQEDNEKNYLTASFAEELKRKHGDGYPIKMALRLETLDAALQYLRLLKLADLPDVFSTEDDCTPKPFKMFDFGECGFFVFESDEEGCF